MRDQLHLMELVDSYLDGTMNPTDRTAFEERLRNSEELRSLVEDQQRLRQAARRSPARAAAKKAYRNYRWGKSLPGIGVGSVVLITATAALFLWKSQMADSGSVNAPVSESEYRALTDTTGTHLDPLVLTIDPKKDTTLITPNGIVLDIPQGAFVDRLGAAIATSVRVTILEALDPLDIMKAGLSTMSGDTLLETGGMFYLDAQANGKAVRIDPAKSLTAMVPADGSKEGMQLYEGVKRDDGVIDWRNPKPLKKSLVPVDINTLNFYPPDYEAKLAELGQDVTSKAFKDSLYYSMRCPEQSIELMYEAPQQRGFIEQLAFRGHGAALALLPQSQPTDSVRGSSETFFAIGRSGKCGIDPLKIKAIWNARFNKTNLATKEFEQRLAYIFSTCDNALLDVYVNNLDKDLHWCDSLATRMHAEPMSMFLEPKTGRVDLPAHAADRLQLVYAKWSSAYAEAIAEEQDRFTRLEDALDAKGDALRASWDNASLEQRGQMFNDAFPEHFKQAMHKAGLPVSTSYAPPRMAYVVPVVIPRWYNCDRPVRTGAMVVAASPAPAPSTVPITTQAFGVNIPERSDFDVVRGYLLPRGWQSFQRLNETDGRFTADLSSDLSYDLVCLASRGGSSFWFKQENVLEGETTAQLAPTNDTELRRALSGTGVRLSAAVLNEASYVNWLAADNARRKRRSSQGELQNALRGVVFPCAAALVDSLSTPAIATVGTSTQEVDESSPIMEMAAIQDQPQFPGGEVALYRYISTSIKYPDDLMDAGIGGKVYVQFTIEENGDVADVSIVRSIDPRLDFEALSVIRGMPRWTPGVMNGSPVRVRLNIPIEFRPR